MPRIEGVYIYDKYWLDKDGRIFSTRLINRSANKPQFKELKQSSAWGYPSVNLSVNNKRFTLQIHVAMLENFVGPRPPGHLACHRDGNPRNNKIENLYWGTPKQNMLDRSAHGRAPIGENNKSSKLTAAQVKSIKAMWANGIKQIQIAKQFGVCRDTVRKITNGTYWKHLSKEKSE